MVGMTELDDLMCELELVPLARAMVGVDVAITRKILPSWCLRRESMQAYVTLSKIPDDQIMSTFTSFMTMDPYMMRAVQNIGSDASSEGIKQKMYEGWVKRTEQYYMTKILQAPDTKEKLIYANAIKALYHQQAPEVYVVDMANPSPPEDFLMMYEGVYYRPRGDLSIIKAKAKSGKSTYLKIEIAAMISPTGQVNGMSRSYIDGTETIRDPYNVLWVDTEQSHASSDKSYRQVLQMAGLPLDHNDPHLTMINSRMSQTQSRLERVEEEVEVGHYDVVVLDGVKDVAKDINDPQETDNIVARILQLVQDTKVSFVTVIHENPAKDSDKMRGWLGTELGNKGFEVQEVRINQDTGVFSVVNTERREKTIPPYGFRYNDDDLLEQCDPDVKGFGQGQGQNRSQKKIELDNQTRYCNQVKKAFEDNPNLQHTHADLIRLLIKKCGLTDATARNRIKTACDAEVIRVVAGEQGKRGAEYALAPQTQSELNILNSQNAKINEDGTIPDIFTEDNGQLDDCPY